MGMGLRPALWVNCIRTNVLVAAVANPMPGPSVPLPDTRHRI